MSDTALKPFAVITGGSNELAKEFLANGYDVMIAAEDSAHLAEAAQNLGQGGARVESHASDLSTEDGVGSLHQAISALGRPVDTLCVNAGYGLGGAFVETDLQRELRMIDLNCRGAVQLTKLVLKEMVARDCGKLLFTSSIAATMPDPFEAVYGSTKVFLRWFGEALREELKDTGVGVTVLMPSVTGTDFFHRAEMDDTKAGASDKKDDPAMVARKALEALQQGRDKVLPGLKNKIMGGIAEALSDTASAAVHRGMSEPGSANK